MISASSGAATGTSTPVGVRRPNPRQEQHAEPGQRGRKRCRSRTDPAPRRQQPVPPCQEAGATGSRFRLRRAGSATARRPARGSPPRNPGWPKVEAIVRCSSMPLIMLPTSTARPASQHVAAGKRLPPGRPARRRFRRARRRWPHARRSEKRRRHRRSQRRGEAGGEARLAGGGVHRCMVAHHVVEAVARQIGRAGCARLPGIFAGNRGAPPSARSPAPTVITTMGMSCRRRARCRAASLAGSVGRSSRISRPMAATPLRARGVDQLRQECPA